MTSSTPEFIPEITPDDAVPTRAAELANRRHQILPIFSAAELRRLERFGHRACYADGSSMFKAGSSDFGMLVILSGKVAISRHEGLGKTSPMSELTPGQFVAEVAQLSGRPALVNGHAVGNVEVLIISSESLRALVVAEAELGERIVRALILRRVGLIETGAGGPVLIGAPGAADMVRL